jgi:quinol-cytochrome oxidoreductase complex cytochrome b subunit
VWGNFSVSNATLNRFFSLHYLLPFILAALAAMHLLALHEHGSSNPLGVSGNTDRLPFHPYFTFKDLVTRFVFLLALSLIAFYAPNVLGHRDNYIPANPMQTPASIDGSSITSIVSYPSIIIKNTIFNKDLKIL